MESTEEVQHFKKTNSDFDFIEQLNDDEQDIFHIEEENTWVQKTYKISGIISFFISILGIIFNIVSFVILRKSDGNKIFKKLLLSLGK